MKLYYKFTHDGVEYSDTVVIDELTRNYDDEPYATVDITNGKDEYSQSEDWIGYEVNFLKDEDTGEFTGEGYVIAYYEEWDTSNNDILEDEDVEIKLVEDES